MPNRSCRESQLSTHTCSSESTLEYTQSGLLCFWVDWHKRSRDLCNQYAIQRYALCPLRIENNNRRWIYHDEKGKIPIFLLFFSLTIYSNVRKIYFLLVSVKTLPDGGFMALKVVFEVVSLRRWFRNSICWMVPARLVASIELSSSYTLSVQIAALG